MNQTLFLSYAWKNGNIADAIDLAFEATGVAIHRDIRGIHFKDSIKNFMQKIRQSDFALVLISEDFLKSSNCMFEILELMKDVGFEKKILPILLQDTNIFRPEDKLEYVKYWKDKFENLQTNISEVDSMDSIELIKELKHYLNIKSSIGEFLSYLSDISILTFGDLQKNNFKPIFDYIGISDGGLIKDLLTVNAIKDIEDKEIELDRLEDKYHQNSKIYFVKAYTAFSQNNIKKSTAYYRKSISIDPNFGPSYYNLGYNLDFTDGLYEEAIINYDKAIELNPYEIRAYINLGRIYSSDLKDIEKAKKLFLAAIEIDPYDSSAHAHLARLLHIEFKDYKIAKDHYKIALRFEHDAATALNYAMLLWRHFQDFFNAKKYFKVALKLDRNHKMALKQFGLMLELEYKDYQTAKMYLDRFIQIEPNDAAGHFFYASFLAVRFIEIKEYKIIAQEHYIKAISLSSALKSNQMETLLNI